MLKTRLNKNVIIYPNKVYTSGFIDIDKCVPSKRQISMAYINPSGFRGYTFEELIPPRELQVAYKNGEISETIYREVYEDNILALLNPVEVYERLSGMVLCSWGNKSKFSPRLIVTNWLGNSLGFQFIGGEI